MIGSEAEARTFCAERTDARGMARLEQLGAALAAENERQNLVSVASLASIWQRHFADSLQLLDHVPRGTETWLDLGTGAGFPGLAIAIAAPDRELVLVESRKRRVDWLEACVRALELAHCHVVSGRLESLEAFPAAAISARAFAPLDKLLRLSARFSTPATAWVLPKGRSAAQELANQSSEVRAMFHVEQSQTDPGGGILVGKGTPRLS
jgi:16S rRNA (guanine527-N7)-methyltransferase